MNGSSATVTMTREQDQPLATSEKREGSAVLCEWCYDPIDPARIAGGHGLVRFCTRACARRSSRGSQAAPKPTVKDEDNGRLPPDDAPEAFFLGAPRHVWEAVCLLCSRTQKQESLTDEQVRLRRLLGEPNCTTCRGLVYLEPAGVRQR